MHIISVESDVESLVSRYEKHLKVDRQMDEENAEEEMEIAENGPLLVHADLILKKAMHRYWKDVSQNGEWHFVMMKTESLFKASKVMDRLKSENLNCLLWTINDLIKILKYIIM